MDRRKGFEEAWVQINGKAGAERIDAIDVNSKALPHPLAFPVEAMPKFCRPLIREAAASIGCPVDFVGLSMLVTIGSAIGNSRRVKVKDGWTEGATIYAAVIAAPGDKKSPAKEGPYPPIKSKLDCTRCIRRG